MRLPVALSLVAISAGSLASHFPESRTYVHALLSERECAEARRRFPVFNCYQTIRFETDGSATVLFTDIMNLARYDISGDEVTVTPRPASEIAAPLVLKLSSDGRQLKLISDGKIFTRKEAR